MDAIVPTAMNKSGLDQFLRREFPQFYRSAAVIIEHADGKSCRLRQTYDEGMLRPGGTISGPTLMALSDVAMYVVLLSAIGPVGLAVTTNLNISFLSKAPEATTSWRMANCSSLASAWRLARWRYGRPRVMIWSPTRR